MAMKLVQDEDTRKMLSRAAATDQNDTKSELVEKLIQKRHEFAQELGYSSFAELSLEKRMANDVMIVQNFEENLINLMMKKGKEELNQLTELKRKHTGNKTAKFMSWDFSFYNNMYQKENLNIDMEFLKEYFPME